MTLNLGAAIAHIASIRTELAQRTGCTEWDNAGIRAALITTEGAPCDVSAAACLAAGDAALKYPSEAALRAHWPKNATSQPAPKHGVACLEHPEHDHPCPHPDHRGDMTPEQIREAAAAIRATLATRTPKETP